MIITVFPYTTRRELYGGEILLTTREYNSYVDLSINDKNRPTRLRSAIIPGLREFVLVYYEESRL